MVAIAGHVVLLADDEIRLRELVRSYLVRSGYQVIEAGDGRAALSLFGEHNPDIVVLDIMMPAIDGWTVCRNIREQSDVPILMLTARGDELDRLQGFSLGVDDYITKPFSPRELIARIKAIEKRAYPHIKTSLIEYPGLSIDLSSRIAKAKDNTLTLTPKEFDLLAHLASNPRRAFTREQLLNAVWGADFLGDDRTVDTHIKKLREKLTPSGLAGLIRTVWGVGYRFGDEHEV